MKPWRGKLIAYGGDPKTIKGDKRGWATAIQYLAPADLAGGINLCPWAEKAGCKNACLNTSGHGKFNSVQQARIRKTVLFRDNRREYFRQLDRDLDKFLLRCEATRTTYHQRPAVRLNGTSDIQWETIAPWIFENYPKIQFYDYTKIYKRVYKKLPKNYHLTLSYSLANLDYAEAIQKAWRECNAGIAMVFRSRALFEPYLRIPNRVDGDADDLRFLDPKGAIVCLSAKGKARQDTSGFVLD